MAYALKEIGPSIFAAAFCEALAFFIGMLTDVPALRNFCLVAGCGVICDFLLQMTIFVGFLAIDNARVEANRGDLFCCFVKFEKKHKRRRECFRHLFNEYYVPTLFTWISKVIVLSMTVCLIIIGFMSCSKLKLGLNQNVSLVENSDIYDYFETLYDYGDAGPPAYLVFKDVDYENPANL